MQHDLKQRRTDHVRCSRYGAAGRVVAHVVDGETSYVREEIVVGEVVVVVASSRASALPKNLIAPLPYRIMRGGVSEACCPF